MNEKKKSTSESSVKIRTRSEKQEENQVSLTNWAALESMTDEEITRNALDDEDNPPVDDDLWEKARIVYSLVEDKFTAVHQANH